MQALIRDYDAKRVFKPLQGQKLPKGAHLLWAFERAGDVKQLENLRLCATWVEESIAHKGWLSRAFFSSGIKNIIRKAEDAAGIKAEGHPKTVYIFERKLAGAHWAHRFMPYAVTSLSEARKLEENKEVPFVGIPMRTMVMFTGGTARQTIAAHERKVEML